MDFIRHFKMIIVSFNRINLIINIVIAVVIVLLSLIIKKGFVISLKYK
jgi:hypothetical protein